MTKSDNLPPLTRTSTGFTKLNDFFSTVIANNELHKYLLFVNGTKSDFYEKVKFKWRYLRYLSHLPPNYSYLRKYVRPNTVIENVDPILHRLYHKNYPIKWLDSYRLLSTVLVAWEECEVSFLSLFVVESCDLF